MMSLFALEQEISYYKTRIQLDESLISAIGEGNIDAFETLYNLTDCAVFGFALSILRNRQDAEDVMHDSYLQIRKYAPSYQAKGKPMAWILTIVKHLAFAYKTHPSRQHQDIDARQDLSDQGNDMVGAENRMLLLALLEQLSDQEREIIVLHVQTGMKHREIAEILDLPLATVLSKYRRAIAKLQKAAQTR